MSGNNFSNGFTTDYSNPCFGCVPPERHVGCHSKCEKRAKWLEIHEARKKHLRDYMDADRTSREGYVRVADSVRYNGLIYGSKFSSRKGEKK